MVFFNKEVELRIPPKKQNNKTVEIKPLNGYGAIREKLAEGNTMTVKQIVQETTKPKTKVSIGM